MGKATEIYLNIINRFKEVNKKENLYSLLYGAMLSSSLLALVFFIFIGIEGVFHLNITGRTILFFLLCSLFIGILSYYFILPVLKYLRIINNYNEETLANRVGIHFPSVNDSLLNSLQLFRSINSRYNYSSGLIEASLSDVNEKIANLNFQEIIDKEKIRRFFLIAAFILIAFIISFTSSSDFYLGSLNRIINFNQSFLPPAPFSFEIKPGNIELTKGDSVSIVITVIGEKQEKILLFSKNEEQKDFESVALLQDSKGQFIQKIKNLRVTLEYYAEAKEIQSEKYIISIVDRPVIRNLRILMNYPGYSGIPAKYLDDNTGEISALNGTKAKIDLKINKEIKQAKVVFSDSTELPMILSGKNALAEIKVQKNCSYHFELEDEKGIKNIDAIEYPIKVIPDEFPYVIIVEPGKNVDIKEDMRLPMEIKIKDDFGFSKMKLGYRLVKSKFSGPQEKFDYIDIPLPSLKGPEVNVPYIWNLTNLSLAPEDVVAYIIEIYDNDNISGPKSSKTSEYFVRFPSLDEIFSKVDNVQKQAVQELDKTFDESKELKKKVDEINQDLKKNKDNLDWQKQKKIEETLKRYQDLQKKVDQVSKNLEEMTKAMQENKLISQETMDKYMELQKLFSEINSEEFSKAMKKLQESMQSLNPDAVKQAMKNFTFDEQNFREGIERTTNLLKRIIIEQKTDEISKRIDNLIEKQEELKNETAKANPNDKNKLDELAKKQNEIAKELKNTQDEMKDLEKRMSEFPEEMPAQDMKEILQDMQNQDNESQMDEAMSEMKSGQNQRAKDKQEKVVKNLKDVQKQMQKMKKELLEGQKQQILNALRKSLREILEISKQQEGLKNQSQASMQNLPRNREIAQKQMELQEDLTNVVNQLYMLSQKTFVVTPDMGKSIGTAISNMQQAITNLVQRDNFSAASNQGSSMAALNRAALQIQEGMEQMGQQGGQGGGLQSLLQKLSEMAGKQQGINQGMGSVPMSGQGQMTMEQQAALSRILGEQQAVKKSLDELKEEAQQYGNKDKIMGDLEQISKEMEEVIKEMKQNNVDQNTIQKQERILSRLLDAQRSMRERDFEKKRKSDPGKDFIRQSPKDIDLNSLEGRNKLQQDLLKAIEEGYSKDYEDLIKKYYESLQKVQINKKNK